MFSVAPDSPRDSYGAGRLFRVARPLLSTLLSAGEVDFAVELLAQLRRVPAEVPVRRGPDLVVVPNAPSGTLYATRGHVLEVSSDTTISQVVMVANRALGMVINVEDDPTFRMEAPPRGLGFPQLGAGGEFEHVAMARTKLKEVSQRLGNAPFSLARGLVDISGLPLPWQALLVRAAGRTLPLVRSFEEPGADRPIRRAVLWTASGGGSYTAQLEQELLASLFGERLQVIDGDEAGKARFIEEYNRSDLDLIWVVGHGEFDHYNPHRAALKVSSTESCGLGELQRPRHVRGERRLLVFNVCDGGATAALNAPGELGLAALLAGASQAVVSHFCPVEPRTALLFGGLLATELAGGRGYFASFEAALSVMLQGRDGMRAVLVRSPATAPLAKRLDLWDLSLGNILEVGTGAFNE